MNTVRFIIRRKAAFVGALLPYHIYINGDYGPYLLGKLTNHCAAVGVSPQPVGN